MKVSQIAKVIGYSPEDLLDQIKAAGLKHASADDEISNEDLGEDDDISDENGINVEINEDDKN